ncbi:MAG: DUF6600 domain-containing protein [Betaproteobacteria bacterium]
MKIELRIAQIVAFMLGVTVLAFAGMSRADPPGRVARLADIGGAVSFSPAGENDWVLARINRPLVPGDRLWADPAARAELQAGSTVIRVGGRTSVTVLNLDDNVIQLQLAEGTLNVRVRRLGPSEVVEIDTPNLAFTVREPGDYRVVVDSAGDATTVVTRAGRADVYGEGAAYVVEAQRTYRFAGTGLRDYEEYGLPAPDDFDRWAVERDRRWERSVSARYVSPDVIGYQDLDDYGTWRSDRTYGNVWIPSRVPAGWAPYHDGHWAWIDPWGWTWVDDAPWGFAVSHYGRWTDLGGTWGWVPGPARARAVYAPALVAFVGGSNFQLSVSTGNVAGVAWFPLGPRDVYRPTYAVSRNYFTNINTTNTVINNTQITNVYNNTNVTNVTYLNQRVPGAVIAVPTSAFAQSQPVSNVSIRMSQLMVASTPVTSVAAVAPVQASVIGAAAPARSRPPAEVLERKVVARRAPAAAPIDFSRKERKLAENPGRPLDAAELKALKPAAPVAAANVEVIAPTQATKPVAAPPEQRGKPRRQGRPDESNVAAPSGAPAPSGTAPNGQRGRADPPGKSTEPPAASPGKPAVPAVAAPAAPAAVPPTAPAAPVASPRPDRRAMPVDPSASRPVPAPGTPDATPAEQRGRSERGGRAAPPQSVAPMAPSGVPAGTPQPVAPAAPAVPPSAAPAKPPNAPPAAERSEPRGKAGTPPSATESAPQPPTGSAPAERRGRSGQRGKSNDAPPAKEPPPPAAVKAPTQPPPAAATPQPPPPPAAATPQPPAPKERAGKGGKKKGDEQLKQEEEEKKSKS